MAQILHSSDAVIDELGGTNATAGLTDRDPRAVSNWRRRRLPPETYLLMIHALGLKGKTALPNLWGIIAPDVDKIVCLCLNADNLPEGTKRVTETLDSQVSLTPESTHA